MFRGRKPTSLHPLGVRGIASKIDSSNADSPRGNYLPIDPWTWTAGGNGRKKSEKIFRSERNEEGAMEKGVRAPRRRRDRCRTGGRAPLFLLSCRRVQRTEPAPWGAGENAQPPTVTPVHAQWYIDPGKSRDARNIIQWSIGCTVCHFCSALVRRFANEARRVSNARPIGGSSRSRSPVIALSRQPERSALDDDIIAKRPRDRRISWGECSERRLKRTGIPSM